MTSPSETSPSTDQPAVALDDFKTAIDRDAEIPIGVQLAWALRARIQAGRLQSGQRLPGLRELAEATGVNINTVRSVYQRLDREGLIDSQQGSGTFVAQTRSRSAEATTIATSAAQDARDLGIDPREVAAALYVSPERSTPVDEGRDDRSQADRRRLLRRQIASLEQTLAEIEAAHPGVAPAAPQARRGIGPALLSCQELEQVRALLVRRLTIVQAAVDDRTGADEAQAAPVPTRRKTQAKVAKASKRTPRAQVSSRPAPASG